MTAKRALVVDDSKSARAFLAKLLEEQSLEVDAAETAEQAIDYLAHHRPDVIFMDHLMPGMDGFQAVQTIKNNPRTSAIPILMYTSQEGDLYLGQARALGAEGVLPKQIKQSDVTRMLFQLRLVADRRAEDRTTFMRVEQGPELLPANESAIVVEPRIETSAAIDAPPNVAGNAPYGSGSGSRQPVSHHGTSPAPTPAVTANHPTLVTTAVVLRMPYSIPTVPPIARKVRS